MIRTVLCIINKHTHTHTHTQSAQLLNLHVGLCSFFDYVCLYRFSIIVCFMLPQKINLFICCLLFLWWVYFIKYQAKKLAGNSISDMIMSNDQSVIEANDSPQSQTGQLDSCV